jgi:hypothetical protein
MLGVGLSVGISNAGSNNDLSSRPIFIPLLAIYFAWPLHGRLTSPACILIQ